MESQRTMYDIPLSHLDYEYLKTCSNTDEIERIVKILRSGKEGKFPDLERFAENKLKELKPESKVLRKPERPATAADLDKEEWMKIDSDLKQWMNEVKSSEASLLEATKTGEGEASGDPNTDLPPVRGSTNIPLNKDNEKSHSDQASNKEKRVKPRDYREWDKFDIDAELRKVEEIHASGDGEKPMVERPKSGLSETPQINELDAQLQEMKANREKDKGNEAFRAGDVEEALLYYTRSINILPTIAAINNRAQTYVKLKNWSKALDDCDAVLILEPDNLKALFRRGAANQGLTRYVQAREDLEQVLKKEPNNRNAKELLKSVEKSLAEQKVKGRRMMIEEVSGSEDEESEKVDNHLLSQKSSAKGHLITEIEDSGKKVTGTNQKISPGNSSATDHQVNNVTDSNKSNSGERSDKSTDHVVNNIKGKTSSSDSASSDIQSTSETTKSTDGSQSDLCDKTSSKTNQSQARETKAEASAVSGSSSEAVSGTTDKEKVDHGYTPTENGKAVVGEAVCREGVPCKKDSTTPQYDPKLYPDVVALIDKAHSFYWAGQYGEACEKFNKALELLVGYKAEDEYLSMLYANRASCHMTLGDCRSCVRDCNTALSIDPHSKDVLLLRASAYELMDKFREAYVDFVTISNATSDLVARRGSDRCSSMMKQLYGLSWREKLPKIPKLSLLTSPSSSFGPFSRSVNCNAKASSAKTGASAGATPSASTEAANESNTCAKVVVPEASADSTIRPAAADAASKSAAVEVTKPVEATVESATVKEELFEKYKEEGNSLFSKGEFKKAVVLFTRCAEMYPDRVVPYTNRALCHLRLMQFEKVLDDCNQALGLDFQNIKALFRRAQAYRLLDQWDQSIIDLETLLMIDRGNTAAKKELNAVLQAKEEDQEKRAHLVILKEQQQRQQRRAAAAAAAKLAAAAAASAAADGSKAKQSSKSQHSTDKPSTTAAASDTGREGTEEKKSGRKSKKGSSDERKGCCMKKGSGGGGVGDGSEKGLSPYEFLQSWTSLRQTSDIRPYVDLLTSVKPTHLKTVISNKLEGEFLLRLVRCITDLVQSGKPDVAAAYLRELPNLDRFDMVYMFLSDSEKKDIKELFNTLEMCLADKDILATSRQRFTV